jgi:hypothetical protein
MPPLEHGFLGPEADKTRQQILHKYAALFTLLRDLNDVCHEYLGKAKYHEVGKALKSSRLAISCED